MKVPNDSTLSGPSLALSENTDALDAIFERIIFAAEDARNALLLVPSHELVGFAQRFETLNGALQVALRSRYSLLGITGAPQGGGDE